MWGSVSISQISLRFTEANAAFTHSGAVNFWLTSDNATDIQPGSTLAYDSGSLPDGIGSQLSSVYALGSGTFDTDGSINSGTMDTYVFDLTGGVNEDAFAYLTSVALSGGTVRALVSPGDATTAATWAGFSNSSDTGPEIAFQYTAVPEPQTWALLLVGLGTVAWSVRRRR